MNAEDADNWTALLCASKEGYLDVCRELLDHGAEVDHRDIGSWTPLLWAAYKGCFINEIEYSAYDIFKYRMHVIFGSM